MGFRLTVVAICFSLLVCQVCSCRHNLIPWISLLRVAPNKEIAALQSRSLFRLKFPSPNSAQPGYEPQDTGPNYVRNALRLYLRNRSDFPEYDCASAF